MNSRPFATNSPKSSFVKSYNDLVLQVVLVEFHTTSIILRKSRIKSRLFIAIGQLFWQLQNLQSLNHIERLFPKNNNKKIWKLV